MELADGAEETRKSSTEAEPKVRRSSCGGSSARIWQVLGRRWCIKPPHHRHPRTPTCTHARLGVHGQVCHDACVRPIAGLDAEERSSPSEPGQARYDATAATAGWPVYVLRDGGGVCLVGVILVSCKSLTR